MMLIIFILIAFISSWIWIDYFREIKIIDKSKTPYLLLSFSIGAIVYFLNYFLNGLIKDIQYTDSNILNHLINSVLKAGFVSELLKLIPIYILYHLVKTELTEPISIFLYFTVSALGFSFSHNIFYVLNNNLYLFNDYVILNTLNDLFCSAFVSYAIINYRFYKKSVFDTVVLILLVILLAGLYDFWLYFERVFVFGVLVSIFYFAYLVSIFSTILTNSINISSDFSYLKVIGSKKVFRRYFLIFASLVFVQFIILTFTKPLSDASTYLFETLWFTFLIVLIVFKRVSKLKLIEGYWSKPKLKLPFTFYYSDAFNGRQSKFRFKFRGETFNEAAIDFYLKNICSINPLSKRNSYILKVKQAEIKEKIFLKNHETFYLVKVLNDDKFDEMLLKPKLSGKNLVKKRHAIAALLTIPEGVDITNKELSSLDFVFREWVFIKYR